MHFSTDKKAKVTGLDNLVVRDVKDYIYHPDYDATTHLGDIVILKLDKHQSFEEPPYVLVGYSIQQMFVYLEESRKSNPAHEIYIAVYLWDPKLDKDNFIYSEIKTAYLEPALTQCPPQGGSM